MSFLRLLFSSNFVAFFLLASFSCRLISANQRSPRCGVVTSFHCVRWRNGWWPISFPNMSKKTGHYHFWVIIGLLSGQTNFWRTEDIETWLLWAAKRILWWHFGFRRTDYVTIRRLSKFAEAGRRWCNLTVASMRMQPKQIYWKLISKCDALPKQSAQPKMIHCGKTILVRIHWFSLFIPPYHKVHKCKKIKTSIRDKFSLFD